MRREGGREGGHLTVSPRRKGGRRRELLGAREVGGDLRGGGEGVEGGRAGITSTTAKGGGGGGSGGRIDADHRRDVGLGLQGREGGREGGREAKIRIIMTESILRLVASRPYFHRPSVRPPSLPSSFPSSLPPYLKRAPGSLLVVAQSSGG